MNHVIETLRQYKELIAVVTTSVVLVGWILREIHLRHYIKKIAHRLEPTALEKAKAAAKAHKRKKRLEGRVSKKQKRLEKKLSELTT